MKIQGIEVKINQRKTVKRKLRKYLYKIHHQRYIMLRTSLLITLLVGLVFGPAVYANGNDIKRLSLMLCCIFALSYFKVYSDIENLKMHESEYKELLSVLTGLKRRMRDTNNIHRFVYDLGFEVKDKRSLNSQQITKIKLKLNTDIDECKVIIK